MKKSTLAIVLAASTLTLGLKAQGMSTQAMGGANPRPQAMGGANPRPQAMGGANPRPQVVSGAGAISQDTFGSIVSAVFSMFGFSL